ncbi:hypothetical protein Tco_1343899 [Tanacetum coccineum]
MGHCSLMARVRRVFVFRYPQLTKVVPTLNIQTQHLEDPEEEKKQKPVPAVSECCLKSTRRITRNIMNKLEKDSWELTTPEKIETCGRKKEEGNTIFKKQKYEKKDGFKEIREELVQRAATIAAAKSGIKIEVTHLERILPQVNFRSLRIWFQDKLDLKHSPRFSCSSVYL